MAESNKWVKLVDLSYFQQSNYHPGLDSQGKNYCGYSRYTGQ